MDIVGVVDADIQCGVLRECWSLHDRPNGWEYNYTYAGMNCSMTNFVQKTCFSDHSIKDYVIGVIKETEVDLINKKAENPVNMGTQT